MLVTPVLYEDDSIGVLSLYVDRLTALMMMKS